MKTLMIEGYTVNTNLDEQDVFQKCCRIEGIDPSDKEAEISIERELICANIVDFIEKVAIAEIPVSNYFYENSRGYKDRGLEPFNWHASKSKLTLFYTGTQGGESWYADILLK